MSTLAAFPRSNGKSARTPTISADVARMGDDNWAARTDLAMRASLVVSQGRDLQEWLETVVETMERDET